MRKRAAKKRPLLPDPRFNDQLVTRFVNNLMWDGKKSTAFKVFYDAIDIIESKKREGETSITLNEAKLKAERDELEAKSLARVNKLRISRGLAPIKKGDKTTKEDAFDFVQQESLNIMVDFMKMSQSNKTAKSLPIN